MKEKSSFVPVVVMTAAILLSLWYVLPEIRLKFRYPEIAVSSFTLICFMGLNASREYQRIVVKFMFAAFLIAFLHVIPYNFDLKKCLNIFQQQVIFFMPMFVYLFLCKDHKKYLKYIAIVLSLLLLYVFCKTFWELRTNDRIMRRLAYGVADDDFLVYRQDNIGGYGFAYSVGMLINVFLAFFMILKSKLSKGTYYLPLIGILYCFTAMANFFLNLIITSTVFVYVLFSTKKFVFKTVAIIATVIFILCLPSIFNFIAENIEASVISQKFYRVAEFFQGNREASEVDRVSVYTEALKLFLSSPVWGIYNIYENVDRSVYVSAHADLISMLCRVGILGVGIYFYLLHFVYKTINATFPDIGKHKVYCFAFIQFILIYCTNTAFQCMEFGTVLLLYIPSLILFFSQGQQQDTDDTNNQGEIIHAPVEK